jgi:hypothetical protein
MQASSVQVATIPEKPPLSPLSTRPKWRDLQLLRCSHCKLRPSRSARSPAFVLRPV